MSNIIAFQSSSARPNPVPSNPSFGLPPENVRAFTGSIREPVKIELAPSKPETATARNLRLRKQRSRAWYAAWARVGYYEAAMAMHSAIGVAQRADIDEGRYHNPSDCEAYYTMLASHRRAKKAQLLTPASRLSDVEWKRKTMASAQFKFLELSPLRAQQIIDEDLEFLASHPVRKAKCG